MKKLKDLLKESNYLKYKEYAIQKHEGVNEDQRTAFLEAVKLYKEFADVVYKKDGLKEVYENIRHIVDVAGKMTIDETEQWFDGVTVSRHMKRMNESFKLFEKTLKEMYPLQQRLESTYDEIGEVLGKYYEINELEEGNEFGAARAKAIAAGEDEFEVDGKTFPVKSVGKDDKANAKKFAKESVNEAMLSPKAAKKLKIGNTIKTKNGTYKITGYGQKTGATRNFEAEKSGQRYNLRVSLRGTTSIEVAKGRSLNFTDSEMLESLKEDYNGWTNWDTWNANNWLTNDESSYKTARRARDGRQVKDVFLQLFGKNHDDINVNKVDWDEIHDGLNESVNESTKLTDILKKKVKSVNEAKFNKAKLLKALGNNDDGYIIVKGKKYIIYNPDSSNPDNTAMWGNNTVKALIPNDGDEKEFKYSDIDGFTLKESVNEAKIVVTGEIDGKPQKMSGPEFEESLKNIAKVAKNSKDFVTKVIYSITDETEDISTKDKMTLTKWYNSNMSESVNESNELKKLEDAIKMFQDKIKKQGMVTNARDEEHLARLKKMYNKMGGKLESVNEALSPFKTSVRDGGMKDLIGKYKKYSKSNDTKNRRKVYLDLIKVGQKFQFKQHDWKTLGRVSGAGEEAFKPKYIKQFGESTNEQGLTFHKSAFGESTNESTKLTEIIKK